jgi:AAA+ ATPase superfamily predicted ATPase
VTAYNIIISGHIIFTVIIEDIELESIVGRRYEQSTLQRIFDSLRAEFLAIYGRRRVGKTYLIKQFYMEKTAGYFQVTGVKEASIKEQLNEFSKAVEKTFYPKGTILKEPRSWMQAMEMLTNAFAQFQGKEKIVIFFDEIPWLATKKSRFLPALDYYWNTQWSSNPRILLIVCGSAASWVIANIINNKGGLHNRITEQIRLDPFTLSETKQFLEYRRISLNNDQILSLYMAMGGVPHYLNQLQTGLSAVQNIDRICFTSNGLLFKEFNNLFASLFKDADLYIDLIRKIAKQRNGIERSSLLSKTKKTSGGRFNKRIQELAEAGFINISKPYGHHTRGQFYRVIDEYSLFYLNWIEPHANNIQHQDIPNKYWDALVKSPSWNSWSGIAFEAVCFKHITNIRDALGISVTAQIGSWRYATRKNDSEQGAQIALLFDRDDDTITICEIKYTEIPFQIDKQYKQNLLNKIAVYVKHAKTTKQIFMAMITSSGIKTNSYSEGFITNLVILADLFKPK